MTYLTQHRTVRSAKDLLAIHKLIAGLLDKVKKHNLVVNTAKCVILVKLVGCEAASLFRKHSCRILDAKGVAPGSE